MVWNLDLTSDCKDIFSLKIYSWLIIITHNKAIITIIYATILYCYYQQQTYFDPSAQVNGYTACKFVGNADSTSSISINACSFIFIIYYVHDLFVLELCLEYLLIDINVTCALLVSVLFWFNYFTSSKVIIFWPLPY